MPPWSLHHLMNALTPSPISLFRPGAPEKPRSSPYPIVMVLLVTPRSVAPVALPLPQGESKVPNFVVVADDDPPFPEADEEDAGLPPRPPPPPHAEIATVAAMATPTKPSERLLATSPPRPFQRSAVTVPQSGPDEERFRRRD